MTRLPLFACVLAVACSAQSASAQGYFQQATGIRTPEQIRVIAPNGVQLFRPSNDDYHFGDPEIVQVQLNNWRTPEGHTFQRVSSGWVEFDARGVVLYRFREVRNDGTTADLLDASRNLYVRLTANQAYWGQPGGHPWNFMYGRVR